MWTETTRPRYERSGLRYASDLAAPCLRRQRLCRTEAQAGVGEAWPMDGGDRQALRGRAGLPTPAPAMGGRAHLRLARSQSQAGQGFRSHHRQCTGLAYDREHPASRSKDRKSLKSNNSFPAGFSEIRARYDRFSRFPGRRGRAGDAGPSTLRGGSAAAAEDGSSRGADAPKRREKRPFGRPWPSHVSSYCDRGY